MKISPDKTQEVLNNIKNKCLIRRCPMCGENNWNIEDKIFELREFNNGDLVIGGGNSSIIPLLALTCSKCGNTQFINAIICGAVNPKDSKTPNNNVNGK